MRSLLEKEKLAFNGANFLDWHRNLRLALRFEKKEYLLTTHISDKEPANDAPKEDMDSYDQHVLDDMEISTLIIVVMEFELQKEFMDSSYGVFDIFEYILLLRS